MQPWQPTALLPVRTVDPAATIVSVDDARAHLRVDDDDAATQAYIEGLIAAAEAHLDGFSGVLGRALITQTWKRSFDAFPCGDTIRLPLAPLQSVSSVMYYDQDGSDLAFGSSNYHAVTDALGPCVRLADTAIWPNTQIRPDAVTVTFVCGYGAEAAAVPAPIVHAAKLLIGHFHENREAVNVGNIVETLPLAVNALLEPYRRIPG